MNMALNNDVCVSLRCSGAGVRAVSLRPDVDRRSADVG